MEASDKSLAVAVIEHVEQATIQHGVVPFTTRFQLKGIGHVEAGAEASLSGLLLCETDGLR